MSPTLNFASQKSNDVIDFKNLEAFGLGANHQLVVYADDMKFYKENIKIKRKRKTQTGRG
jgi:hypothetical protein